MYVKQNRKGFGKGKETDVKKVIILCMRKKTDRKRRYKLERQRHVSNKEREEIEESLINKTEESYSVRYYAQPGRVKLRKETQKCETESVSLNRESTKEDICNKRKKGKEMQKEAKNHISPQMLRNFFFF